MTRWRTMAKRAVRTDTARRGGQDKTREPRAEVREDVQRRLWPERYEN